MTEQLFKEICSKEFIKLNDLVNKGYFETSDFENCVLNLSDNLAMLHQAIRGNNDCKKGRQKSLQASKSAC